MRKDAIKTTSMMITAPRIKKIVVRSGDSWMMPSGTTATKVKTNEVKFETYF